MTRKRRCLIIAGILAGCVAVVLGVLAMLPGSRITKANYDRIREGMSRAAVEEILGKADIGPARVEEGGDFLLRWRHPNGTFVTASFTNDGTALIDKDFDQPDILDKLRHWLGLAK